MTSKHSLREGFPIRLMLPKNLLENGLVQVKLMRLSDGTTGVHMYPLKSLVSPHLTITIFNLIVSIMEAEEDV